MNKEDARHSQIAQQVMVDLTGALTPFAAKYGPPRAYRFLLDVDGRECNVFLNGELLLKETA